MLDDRVVHAARLKEPQHLVESGLMHGVADVDLLSRVLYGQRVRPAGAAGRTFPPTPDPRRQAAVFFGCDPAARRGLGARPRAAWCDVGACWRGGVFSGR